MTKRFSWSLISVQVVRLSNVHICRFACLGLSECDIVKVKESKACMYKKVSDFVIQFCPRCVSVALITP